MGEKKKQILLLLNVLAHILSRMYTYTLRKLLSAHWLLPSGHLLVTRTTHSLEASNFSGSWKQIPLLPTGKALVNACNHFYIQKHLQDS